MRPKTVLFDACVLYPAPLRSFLMYLAVTGIFKARWSNRIHDEWMRNVVKDYPDITRAQVERVRDLMNAHVEDSIVKDFDRLISKLRLPDAHDRHVLAAAIKCRADFILTYNLTDFPESELSQYGVRSIHPDKFLVSQLEADPAAVCLSAKRHRQSLKKPPMSPSEFLGVLEKHGLHQTVATLQAYLASI